MRIAIDARMMTPLATRGIGRYIEELIRAMLEMQTRHRFVLLVRNPDVSPFLGIPQVEHLQADVPWYGVAEQARMPGIFRAARADFVHVPHWNVPLFYHGPFMATIHDVLLRRQPASAKASVRHPLFARIKRLGFRFVLRHAMTSARAILAPTRFTAEEVRKFYPSVSARVVVTGEGVSDLPEPPDAYRPPAASYLFYVGSAYPHKRLDLLLDVWEKIAPLHPDLALVIAGEEDAFMARYVARVKRENLPRVIFLGRVTDADLAALYDHARACVFPSSYEGFGLPPIEALIRGCPVVSSDARPMPEILPNRGVKFFRNGDADGMLRAIDTLLRNAASAREDAQSVRSLVRNDHRWSRAAEITVETYERIGRSLHAPTNPYSAGQEEKRV